MISIKFIKNTEKIKIGEVVNTSKKSAENYVNEGFAEYIVKEKTNIIKKLNKEKHNKIYSVDISKPIEEKINKEDSLQKQILDRWATVVVDEDAIWVNNEGESQVNQDKLRIYGDNKITYTGNEVLWIAPKDSLVFEFEDEPERNKRYIVECESAAKSLGWDYCITGHGGKSDYFRVFNIKDFPMGEDNKIAKLLLFDMLLPSSAKHMLDRTNLGWTLSPVIGHSHWKAKYKKAVHKILRGKNPIEHQNKLPELIIKMIADSKKKNKKYIEKIKLSDSWVEDFLLNYCCSHELPKGARHMIIEKNMAAFSIHRQDRDEIKKRYYEAQGRKHDSLRTWENAILHGEYTSVSAGELANFIKEYNLDYKIISHNIETLNIFDSQQNNNEPILMVTNYITNTLKYWDKQPFFYNSAKMFYLWNKLQTKWDLIDEKDMFINMDKNIKLSGETVSSSVKSAYEESFKRIGRQKVPKDTPQDWIQFKDKVINLKTEEIFDASPDFFFTNPIPWSLGESDETPMMDKIFTQWVGDKYLQTLYEIMAYCCLADYPLHRIFALEGAGSNGKGCFKLVLVKFLGKDNCTSSSLDRIATRPHETSFLYKKLLCEMGETNSNIMDQTDTLKKLSGGDLISYEFKGKTAFSDRSYAKILIASNSFPATTDKTDGFYRRWLIIKFPNRFSEKTDIVASIPDYEYNNLARKCIKLLKKLLLDREFTNEGTIEERKKKYEEVSNPIHSFIEENYIHDVNADLTLFDFCNNFEAYLKSRNKRVIDKRETSKILKDEGYEIKPINRKTFSGEFKTWNYILGLRERNKDDKPLNIVTTEKQSVSFVSDVTHISLHSSYKETDREMANVANETNHLPQICVKNENIKEKSTIFNLITTNLSKQPVDITQLYIKYCGEYTEEQFNQALEMLKMKGDVLENPTGYIQRLD
jgi:putative DNA primase/helicase